MLFCDDQRPTSVEGFNHTAVARALGEQGEPESDSGLPSDETRLRVQTMVRLLQLLVTDAKTPAIAGRRTLVIAYLLRLDAAPQSVRQLAKALGVSGPRAHQILTKLRQNLAALQRD